MTSKPFEGHFNDPIHEALKHHTKEPEEVDWKLKFEEVSDKLWEHVKKYMDRTDDLIQAKAENKRLKDVILRLEQRCASAEGRNTELEQHRLALKDRYQAEHGLISCNDCGKLLYRSAKDSHKCEGQGEMLKPSVDHIVQVSSESVGLDSLQCRHCDEVYVRISGHDCKEGPISPIQKCTKCNATFHNSDGHECNG